MPPELGLSPAAMYSVQVENLCLSAAVLRHLRCPLEGMKDFYWPCRMEAFHLPSIVSNRYGKLEVDCVVDSSHNGESVELFLQSLRALERYKEAAVCVLFGAGSEKCVPDMLKAVRDNCDHVVFVQSKHFKAVSEAELGALYRGTGVGGADELVLSPPPLERCDAGTVGLRLQALIDETRLVFLY